MDGSKGAGASFLFSCCSCRLWQVEAVRLPGMCEDVIKSHRKCLKSLMNSLEQQCAFLNTVSHFLWSFELQCIKNGVRWRYSARVFSILCEILLARSYRRWITRVLGADTCTDVHFIMHTWQFDHTHKQKSGALCHSAQWPFSNKYLFLQLSVVAPLPVPPFLHLLHHSLFLSWSLCVNTVLMIHVLILLCQGPKAASITQCLSLLLVVFKYRLEKLFSTNYLFVHKMSENTEKWTSQFTRVCMRCHQNCTFVWQHSQLFDLKWYKK